MEIENKKQGLFSAVILATTAMIGSGWLFAPQRAAVEAGNWAFMSWILAAIILLLVGICLSKVVEVFPVRGVTARSSALSHNNIFGMTPAFANWFGIIVSVSSEAQATAQYVAGSLNNGVLVNADGLTLYGKLLGVGILLFYLLVNFYGMKLLASITNKSTVIKIGVPLFSIVVLLIAHFDKSNFSLIQGTSYGVGSGFGAIITAGLIYSFNGFQLPVAFASELKDPHKNILRAIIISLAITLALYLVLQLAFMGSIPQANLAHGWSSLNFHSPLLTVALLLGLNYLQVILIADSIFSPSVTGWSYLGGSTRMMTAMASEGQFPKWLSVINKKYNFSRRSVLVNFTISLFFLWFSKSWAALAVIVTGYHIIGYMAAPISMGAIKPRTRIFGLFVFIVLGILMKTMPDSNMVLMNISITALMIIYSLTQKKTKFLNLLIFASPFVVYLWLILLLPGFILAGILSALFYGFVTNVKFVDYCKKNREENEIVD